MNVFWFILVVFFVTLFPSKALACEPDCVEKDSWAVGIATGFGDYSNPLHEGKDRNVAVLPSWYYYGEKFYIENTEVGYMLVDEDKWAFKLRGKFNNDGLYFKDSILDGVIISDFLGPGNFDDPDAPVSIDEVDRDLSYLGGVELDYFFNDNIQFSTGIYHDVTNVHNGFMANAGLNYTWAYQAWRFQVGGAAEFRSNELTQYYYGLGPDDGTAYFAFDVHSSINYSLSTSLVYRLNNTVSFIGRYAYEWIDDEITRSPLVVDDHTRFFFIGISVQYGSN